MRSTVKLALSAYAAAFGIMLTVFYLLRVYPFGAYHFLQVDAIHEYMPRITELLNKLRDGGSVFYSWQGGLGNDFYLSLLTALMNPLILIGLLLPQEYITELYAVLILVQIPICASTFAIFIKERFNRDDRFVILFSLMYAFCSFVTAFHWVYYWLPGVAMLPLVATGLERMFKQRKITLYVISLGIGILSNYMMGLFLCIFSFMYYINLVVLHEGGIYKNIKRTFIRYSISSLLSLAIASVVLVPVLFSLQNSVYFSEYYSVAPEFSIMFSILNFFTGHYFLMTPSILFTPNGLPNIYSGLFGFIFFMVYWFRQDLSKKEKLVKLISLFVLYLFFVEAYLDFLIHGRHFTNGLPSRFSYLYIFYLLTMGYDTFINIASIEKKRLFIAFGFIIFFSVLLFILYPQVYVARPGVFSTAAIITNSVLLVLYIALTIFLYKRKNLVNKPKLHKYASILLILLIVTETISSATFIFFRHFARNERESYFIERNNQTKYLLEHVNRDPDFFRMEILPNSVISNGKLFNYNGISIFSIMYFEVNKLLLQFNTHAFSNATFYTAADPVLNSIFGLRYIITKDDMLPFRPYGFTLVMEDDEARKWKNPFSLPIAFMADENLLTWQADDYRSPFDAADLFAQLAAGVNGRLFHDPIMVESINANFLSIDRHEGDLVTYSPLDSLKQEDKPSLDFNFVVPEAGHYFLKYNCLPYAIVESASIEIENASGVSVRDEEYFMNLSGDWDLGAFEAGDRITVSLRIANMLDFADSLELTQWRDESFWKRILHIFYNPNPPDLPNISMNGSVILRVARINDDLFQEMHETLSNNPFVVQFYDDTTVRGEIAVEQAGLMFTSIPYDRRWDIYVNGIEQPAVMVMDALLGLHLDEGVYQIDMKFRQYPIGWTFFLSAGALLYTIIQKKFERAAV